MPTELPEGWTPPVKPTNPGSTKEPEDPADVERERIINQDPESDIPDPTPADAPIPGIGGVPAIM